METPVLRPINKLIEDAFLLIYKRWAPLLVVQGIFYATLFVIAILACVVFMLPPLWFFGIAVMVPITMVISTWAYGAMISSIGSKDTEMISISEALNKGFKVFLPLLGLYVIFYFSLVGGMVLFIFPGLILCAALCLSGYILVLENVSISRSLGTSWEITMGLRWQVLGRLLLLMALIWGVCAILAFASAVPILGIAAGILMFPLNFIILPYSMAYIYCIYEDIRSVRKETYPLRSGPSVLIVGCIFVLVLFIAACIFGSIFLVNKFM